MQARPVLARSAGPAPMAWCQGAAPRAPSAAPGCPMEAAGTGAAPGTASNLAPTHWQTGQAATTIPRSVNIICVLQIYHNWVFIGYCSSGTCCSGVCGSCTTTSSDTTTGTGSTDSTTTTAFQCSANGGEVCDDTQFPQTYPKARHSY